MAEAAERLIGGVVDNKYRLIAHLGAGAFADVFLARHVLIERLCAIKVFRASLTAERSAKERFLREARTVNRIHHPNVVEIIDCGEDGDLVYLVMEYVAGEPLSRMLGEPTPWRRAAEWGVQIASALGRAHQMGIVHRDLKPANVLVVPRKAGADLVKLTDFGMAKLLGEATTTGLLASASSGYRAPEVVLAGLYDARSDLFALGAMLFHAVTTRAAYEEQAWSQRARAGDLAAAPRAGSVVRDVSPGFDEVLAALLAPDPDDRPRDGYEAAALLERSLGGGPLVPPARDSIPEVNAEADRRRRPYLLSLPFAALAPRCEQALAILEAHLREARDPPKEAAELLAQARAEVRVTRGISELVQADAATLEGLVAARRAQQAELGRRFDELARARSRARGWAGTLAERRYEVQDRRTLGADPVPMLEAMVWEQAALEQVEDKLLDRAAELEAEIGRVGAELDALAAGSEEERATWTARLEGRVAALRSSALGAWQSMERAADRLALPQGALLGAVD